MGLLQRFARPEFQLGREGEGERADPEPERQSDATATPAAPSPVDESLVAPAQSSVQEGGDGVTSTAPSTPDVHAGQQHPAQPAARELKVIAFANQKGGVAKTTTTLNLAVAFAEAGHRVLAVDMDPQGNLTMSQGIDPDTVEKSMYHVLVDGMPIRDVIRKREIDVACASIDLAGAEIAMSMKIGRERSLEKALKAVRGDYDFVCIDTPPSLGLLTINALTAADKVIVPVQCEYLSMRGLIQLQNTLSMIREELNPDVEIEGILPTLVDTRTVHAKEAIEILEENFGDRVFATRIRKTIRFAEAPVKGTSVLKYDPEGSAAESYRELAKEVLENGR
jgi:chromosome partitioning protein